MLRDDKIYPNPNTFYPERFMEVVDTETQAKRDPRSYVFGFGRRYVLRSYEPTPTLKRNKNIRQCPGSNLVESSIWLLMVSMLATLDIAKAVDDLGNVIEPEVQFDNSIFRRVFH